MLYSIKQLNKQIYYKLKLMNTYTALQVKAKKIRKKTMVKYYILPGAAPEELSSTDGACSPCTLEEGGLSTSSQFAALPALPAHKTKENYLLISPYK